MKKVQVGDKYMDTYNEFGKRDFKFILGQSYDLEKTIVEVVDATLSSACVRLKKFPLRINKSDGSQSKPIECLQRFKLVREHDYEIGFHFRFKPFT